MTLFKPHPASRLLLAHAKMAARAYDGSEHAADRLIDALVAFEQLVAGTQPKLPRDDAERRIARRLGSSRPVNVNDLLDVAVRRYERSFAENRIAVAIVQSSFAFVPTDGPAPLPPGAEPQHKFERPKISPRTARFLAALTRPGSGVFLDDLRIVRGRVQPGAMRTEPYTLIQLPRHDREVLICDEVGNVSFVGTGLRGEIFWATYQNEQLKQFADITPVINTAHSDARLIDLILHDNYARPKAVVSTYTKSPLTEDIILIHALRYAMTHEGKLPTAETGYIDNLPGKSWAAFDQALRSRSQGLSRPGVTGLSNLFNIYGLKFERKENFPVVKTAIKTLNETGNHGLTINAWHLTEDIILTHALRYAETHNGKLPTQRSGEVEEVPGQNWHDLNEYLRNHSHGLIREGVKGLGQFFNIYRLKSGRKENSKIVAEAIKTLNQSGKHGLTAGTLEAGQLTEDMILIHALLYAKENYGKLPTHDNYDIAGLSGQTWHAWEAALRTQGRGLSREGVQGLSHLFNIYALKTGRKENPEVVAAAIKTLDETGHHGLQVIADRPLSELVARRRTGKFAQLEAA